MDNETVLIGKKIKEARASGGVSYYRIRKDLGMSVAMVKRLEEGRGRAANMLRLTQYLGINLM